MRVALAGATGFIGGAIAHALAAAEHEVHRVGRGDAAAKCDVLVWAAGHRIVDPAIDRAVHVEAAARAVRSAHPDRTIYLSSGECYGDAPVPFREDGPLLGVTSYARAKLDGEVAVFDAARGAAVALRLGVVYGPRQPATMLVSQVARALCRDEPIALTAGTQTRDFVYVDDVAAAVVAAVEAPVVPEVVNIGSGCEVSVRDVCLELARMLGRSEALLGFGAVAMREHEPGRYVLDVSRAARLLGWHARTSLAIGLACTTREAAGRHQ